MLGSVPISRRLLHLTLISLALISMGVGLAFATTSKTTHASGPVSPHMVRVKPSYIFAGPAKKGLKFKCQSNTAPVRCYGPDQIHNAYNILPLLNAGITGKGRTIVIIDAFQSPTIQHDLQLFDKLFDLPDPTLNIYQQAGMPPFNLNDPLQTGWAGEITLDVEWAHAIAPGAAISLVEARSSNDQDIYAMTKFAIDRNLGDVISQSYGEAESCADPTILQKQHQLFLQATQKAITLFAASGDSGAAQATCDSKSYFLSASSPASDPLVTAVGGTTLHADTTTGQYEGETVWNDPTLPAAGGGGFSTIYHKPSYQDGIPGIDQYRGLPDVSYNAAVNGGVLAVFSSSGQGTDLVFIFGGTSAGSPQWAGITALATQKAQHKLGLLNPALYTIGRSNLYPYAFHDITSGNNSFTAQNAQGKTITIKGYSAHQGWDPASGWGSPNVAHLVPLLIQLSTNDQLAHTAA